MTDTDEPWRQANLAFADPATADQAGAEHLAPRLAEACQAGSITTWWFLRKPPGWRLRYQAADPAVLDTALDTLTADGVVASWNHTIYEPETCAFGGPGGMDLAHTLFHHDSHHLLTTVTTAHPAALGRRETTVLLVSSMLRAAGLDWFEQADVWARIGQMRPTPPPNTRPRLEHDMRQLMTTTVTPELLDADWRGAFDDAGRGLAHLAATGTLTRGLRAVLAHLCIFHANRAGLTGAHQARLAALATTAVFGPAPTSNQ